MNDGRDDTLPDTHFVEQMRTNPPRLVVLFQRDGSGNENFSWGVVGNIPVLSLIGSIIELQSSLVDGTWVAECDPEETNRQHALVLAWDDCERTMSAFKSPEIPTVPLLGMLETIKCAIVDSRLAQHAVSQRTQIMGPDGNPMRR